MLCAKRKSGKSYLIGQIIFMLTDPDTDVFIFSETINNDLTWEAILKELDNQGYYVEIHN